jgi:diaminopimelate decarboxylase
VTVRVVGKHCEEGDVLIERTEVPPLRPGDIIALPVSGAYQYSMRSNYNALLHPAVVHVSQGNAFLVVERQKYRDLIAKERSAPQFALAEPDKAANGT